MTKPKNSRPTKIAAIRRIRDKQFPSLAKTNIVRAKGLIRFKKKRHFSSGEVAEFEDAVWLRIFKSSLLPPDARIRIGAAISMYRNESAANRTRLATKRRVLRMRGRISKLVKEATELQRDPIFLNAGLPWWSSRTGPAPADLEKTIEEIQVLDQILADAQDRMTMERGRKSLGPLHRFIMALVWIQAEATGKFVERSTKVGSPRPTSLFIELCVRTADPKIAASSVRNVLTACIADHHRKREEDKFDTATGEWI